MTMRETSPAGAEPPALPRGARGAVTVSRGAPRLAKFQRPSGPWMRKILGCFSTSVANSTRPRSSGASLRRRSASSSLRKGPPPKPGSSAISSVWRRTAGYGRTETESERNVTGRASAWEAPDAISDWTRGVSTIHGIAATAAIVRTTTAATAITNHFPKRINQRRGERPQLLPDTPQRSPSTPIRHSPRPALRGLDGRERPAIGPDGPRERPVLVEVRGTVARALDHAAGGVVD